MSWLGRLFGSSPPPPPPPPPPSNSVVIADDLAAALASPGTSLAESVDIALRAHLEAQRRAAEAHARGEQIPFWLRRDDAGSGEMEDALRERVIQRHAAEDES